MSAKLQKRPRDDVPPSPGCVYPEFSPVKTMKLPDVGGRAIGLHATVEECLENDCDGTMCRDMRTYATPPRGIMHVPQNLRMQLLEAQVQPTIARRNLASSFGDEEEKQPADDIKSDPSI